MIVFHHATKHCDCLSCPTIYFCLFIVLYSTYSTFLSSLYVSYWVFVVGSIINNSDKTSHVSLLLLHLSDRPNIIVHISITFLSTCTIQLLICIFVFGHKYQFSNNRTPTPVYHGRIQDFYQNTTN